MTVCKNLKRAPDAFVSANSGAAIIAGVTIFEASQLACYRKLSQGNEEWGDLKVKAYVIVQKWINLRNGAYSYDQAQHECLICNWFLCPCSVYCPNGPIQPPLRIRGLRSEKMVGTSGSTSETRTRLLNSVKNTVN